MKRQAKRNLPSDKKNERKLRLKQETVRVLSGTELSGVAGGGDTGQCTTIQCTTSHDPIS